MGVNFPIELANSIVEMLHKVTGDNVNFIGEEGIILAAIQKERIGKQHEGGKKIMEGIVNELAISEESALGLKGVLPGYNGVILYKGQRIGCIGLSGDPEKVKPLQKLAAIIVAQEYEKYMNILKRKKIIENVTMEIESISAVIEKITAGSLANFESMNKMEVLSNESEHNMKNINEVLRTIKHITDQTRMLGFNATIEAARVGEAGRAFAVVSQEINKLSDNSRESLANTTLIIKKVQDSITAIIESVRDTTQIAKEQSIEMQNICDSMMDIKTEVINLNNKDIKLL